MSGHDASFALPFRQPLFNGGYAVACGTRVKSAGPKCSGPASYDNLPRGA
jgi:hypothetical protein